MVKVLITNLSDVSKHLYERFDFKYFNAKKISTTLQYPTAKAKHIFEIINGISADTEAYTENQTSKPFIRIAELSYRFEIDDSKVIYLDDDYEIPKKNVLRENDFILATIGATLGKISIAGKYKGGASSNNTSVLRVKRDWQDNFEILFLKYLLQSNLLREQFLGYASQKAQPNLQSYDLENITIPLIPIKEQKKVVPEIEKIEKEIKQLKLKFHKPQEIIDEVFAKEFDYDLKILAQAKQEKVIAANFSDYGKREDLRFSFRFHNAAGRTALKILQGFTQKRIRDFLSEPIKLGAGISPKFYDDENGEAYYLSMATIKNWQFETEEAKKVLKEYWESEQKKNSVRKNDVIIARSGEGTIGKVAIIENDENEAIFCDFTMRVRFANYNSHFAYYYFRTAPFQTLIESNKKGLGNNTNIFPSQIRDFPLPDISLARQDQIVSKIRTQLEEQEAKRTGIEKKRGEIEQIIEKVLEK